MPRGNAVPVWREQKRLGGPDAASEGRQHRIWPLKGKMGSHQQSRGRKKWARVGEGKGRPVGVQAGWGPSGSGHGG